MLEPGTILRNYRGPLGRWCRRLDPDEDHATAAEEAADQGAEVEAAIAKLDDGRRRAEQSLLHEAGVAAPALSAADQLVRDEMAEREAKRAARRERNHPKPVI